MRIQYSIMGDFENNSIKIIKYLSSFSVTEFSLLEISQEISMPPIFHPSTVPDICFIFENTLLSATETIIDEINSICPYTYIMIISNNENRVFDAYAHNIFYFLRCRHLEEDLQAAIKKYLYYIHLQKPSYLSVTKTKSVIIPYEEILYADMYKNTLRIHLTDNTILEERKTLNAFYSAVPSNYFAFLSRSTIVNMIHIRSVATDSITMKNTLTLPIGTTRKETFFSSYRKYIYRKILE